MTGRLIRITATLAVTAAAAIISYRHAYELVSTHGETGLTARLIPFSVDGLILAASMLILDASRRNQPVPPLARWCLGAGIVATVGAHLAHGLGHGINRQPWPADIGPIPGRPARPPGPHHQAEIDGTRSIAAELNRRGARTSTGKSWSAYRIAAAANRCSAGDQQCRS